MHIKVKGNQVLSGEITPSGSKNSAVHIIPCTLLIKGLVKLHNVPDIKDVERLINILAKLGSKIEWNKETSDLILDNSELSFKRLTKEDLGNMKGTSLLWGALLSRFGKVDCEDLPGGCTLGLRPLEPIYSSMRELGVSIEDSNSSVKMDLQHGLPKEIWLPEMSPTATTNLIMLASSLNGNTRLVGAASEPQVQDICAFMIKAGVEVDGIGSNILTVHGGSSLNNFVEHDLLSDHYEITTFLALGAVTGGEVKVHNAIPEHFTTINREFEKFNIKIEYEGNTAIVRANQDVRIVGSFQDKTNVVRAQPWPGLPVDLMPIFIPLALASKDNYILFHNWMYESGLFWVSELTKFGAEVVMCDPHRVLVMGGRKLHGAEIEAPYIIRAVVSLVVSAMISEGESTILNADALYRGHPHFAKNLNNLGADVQEIK